MRGARPAALQEYVAPHRRVRERLGKHASVWRDVLLLERRSPLID
jgi:hypothetical protein